MVSTKKLIKMAKKWQKFAATQRKRILFPKEVENVNEDRFAFNTPTTSSTKQDNGCFVVYSADQQRFRIPLNYLNNEIFKELLKMSEEEFGLPSEGPIILSVDGKILEYIIGMIQRGLAGDIQKALLMSVAITSCSLPSAHQEMRNCQLLVY
ncbi:hypothetical protein LIER_03544 [Lithospermum erythrorhizon]|uniref:Uncharacterized protein n=1 Tax=Lithospermum erythrorhizon TaxID=34254 RepID=A0AAV3NUV0_LITER